MAKKLFKVRANKGFTLMEIIIVIAIIAILAVVAIPSVSGYVEEARESSDLVKVSNIISAIQIGLRLTDHGLPEDAIFEVIWTTSTTNDGRVYDSSIIFRNPTGRQSVFNDGKGGDDLQELDIASGDYEALLTTVVESLGDGEVELMPADMKDGGMYGYIGEGESKLSKKSSLAVHVNTTTGEIALAAPYGWTSSENVNDWADMGLDLIPAP